MFTSGRVVRVNQGGDVSFRTEMQVLIQVDIYFRKICMG